MAKKVTKKFTADLTLNTEQGGGWMAFVSVVGEDGTAEIILSTAWKNASAGKRWIKSKVLELTPRKSVKMVVGEKLDEKGKPTSFAGELTFKA
jgi:hypothetical protein